jgi:hypothetical protein
MNINTSIKLKTNTHGVSIASWIAILLLGIFLYLFFVKINANQHLYKIHAWTTGDWLINYSDGFVRRGFFGQILLIINHQYMLDPIWLIVKVRTAIYLLICVSFFILAVIKRIKPLEVLLVLSPWAFMFELLDPMTVGRKDNLLILVFLVFALLNVIVPRPQIVIKFLPLKDWRFWYLIVTFPIIILIHEGFFLFLQFFY